MRIDRLQRAEVTGDGVGVTARDRSGECGLPALQRVLQCRAGQRSEDALGDAAGLVVDELLTEQFGARHRGAQSFHRVGDDGDDVIAGMRQGGVVQRSRILTTRNGSPPISRTSDWPIA